MSENLLARETSPYLLQHKDNPVHWMPWGTAAFDRARSEDKPVLLSVGYAACHWCHVMAHESFEDESTARLMNSLFINIKVDREERPDIDRIYMQSLHALGEHGGWPLTMFLTPDAEPFWGGTYFPKESRYGRPSFISILTEVSRIWSKDRDKIATNSRALSSALKQQVRTSAPREELAWPMLDGAAQALLGAVDLDHGGLKGAPKFPQAPLFSFLWMMACRSHDETLADATSVTLRNICQGGIYDHLGGGIARYSTDHLWLVPHFEKMLYDNAQLISLASRVWLARREELFRIRIEETIAFILRDMRVPSGAFAASYDADSEGEEGRYYVWTEEEIRSALAGVPVATADLFAETYGVSSAGNWEGHTILNRLAHPGRLAPNDERKLAEARSVLFHRRLSRSPPGFDDKALADWNGLMITALAEAALVFARKDWAAAARDAFAAILGHLWAEGRLSHSWRNGEIRHRATADGYANLIAAALSLSVVGPGGGHLDWARRLTDAMIAHHWDESQGAFCFSSADASMVIVRPAYGEDDVTPNANAVMICNLVRLYYLTGERPYLDRAQTILETFSGSARNNPFGYTSLLRSFAFLSDTPQIVISGSQPDPFGDDKFRAAIERIGPDCVIQWVSTTSELPQGHPALAKAAGGSSRLYLCRGQVCAAPAETATEVQEALELLGLTRSTANT
jgi:uncharacterized protein YyaL (SSP411 family)